MFVVTMEFVLLAFRKFNFPISTNVTKCLRKYFMNVPRSWIINCSWILGQTFGKQEYGLYNGIKINDIKCRSDRISDSLAFQFSSPKLSLAIHSEQTVSNPQKSPVGLGLFGPDCAVVWLGWKLRAESHVLYFL